MSKITSCGIIAEYNPFHNGHAYHLSEAKRRTGADVVVVVMSGNFVQRGEPALMDKETRTCLALTYGADVVLELPWYAAVQSADYFGELAVNILGAVGVEALCFGIDADDHFDYMSFAKAEQEQQSALTSTYQQVTTAHPEASYAKRMEMVYQHVFPDVAVDWHQPNHVLGLSYARANVKQKRPMTVVTVPRKQAEHRSLELGQIASGTAIRQAVFSHQMDDIKQAVPSKTWEALQQQSLHTWNDYWPYLQYEVLSRTTEDLSHIYQMTEGLEHRCQKVMMTCSSFDEWCQALQSSRYTKAKIQRLSTYIMTNTKEKDVTFSLAHPYIKVLGMTPAGRRWFKQQSPQYPVVNNIRQQHPIAFEYEKRYDVLYHLPFRDVQRVITQYHPIMVDQ